MKTRTKLYSTVFPLRSIQGVIEARPGFALLEILYIDPNGNPEEIKAMAMKSAEDRVRIELKIPQYDISINGVMEDEKFVGNYGDLYTIDGTAFFQEHFPSKIDLTFRSAADAQSKKGRLIYTLEPGRAHLRIENSDEFTDLTSEFKVSDRYNWNFKLVAKSSRPSHNAAMELRSDKSANLNTFTSNFEMKTPWKGMEKLRLGSEANIQKNGYIQTVYNLPKAEGSTQLTWSWQLMKDMRFKLKSSSTYEGQPKALLMGVSFKDLGNDLKNVVTTGDIHVNDLWM